MKTMSVLLIAFISLFAAQTKAQLMTGHPILVDDIVNAWMPILPYQYGETNENGETVIDPATGQPVVHDAITQAVAVEHANHNLTVFDCDNVVGYTFTNMGIPFGVYVYYLTSTPGEYFYNCWYTKTGQLCQVFTPVSSQNNWEKDFKRHAAKVKAAEAVWPPDPTRVCQNTSPQTGGENSGSSSPQTFPWMFVFDGPAVEDPVVFVEKSMGIYDSARVPGVLARLYDAARLVPLGG